MIRMFQTQFDSYVCDGESITAERDGFRYVATVHHDSDMGPPWEEHDGHGPVSDWTGRDKRPGELVLCTDRGSRRYYDFAEACRIARRDIWGIPPKGLKVERAPDGKWNWISVDGYATGFPCWNSATRAAYEYVRSTMSPREYAARAARHDFEMLRDWCDDEWTWCGIAVQLFGPDGEELTGDYDFATWGIECNYPDSRNEYLSEVAEDLAQEIHRLHVLPMLQGAATVAAMEGVGP